MGLVINDNIIQEQFPFQGNEGKKLHSTNHGHTYVLFMPPQRQYPPAARKETQGGAGRLSSGD